MLAFGVCLTAVLGVCGPVAAATPPDPSTVLLRQLRLGGYVAAPPGRANGPINQTNVDIFGGTSGVVANELATGNFGAAIRLWTHEPRNGTSVVIAAFWFRDASAIPSFRSGVASVEGSNGFAVAGVPGAVGYDSSALAILGAAAQVYTIIFSKGNWAFVVSAVATPPALTARDVTAIATDQYRAAPATHASSASHLAYRLGEVIGAFLLAGLAIAFVATIAQRRNRPTLTTPAAPEYVLAGSFPFYPPLVREVGWHPVDRKPNEQAYWDGHAWTAQRFWTGRDWAEFPGH